MKVRIKFSKKGTMKFIGHLDIMRYFQKAIRRAEIDIVYTEGFSPHMVMSFASPLGVGITSEGEYFDIEIKSPITSAEAVKRLNHTMVDGVEILSFREIPDDKKNKAMSLVAAADYAVRFRAGYEPQKKWYVLLEQFYNQEEIIIVKKTKKSEKEVDIRPMIYELSYNDGEVFMKLASGSDGNLKPELVMEAFLNYMDLILQEFALEVNRVEVYAVKEGQFVSLENLGKEIL